MVEILAGVALIFLIVVGASVYGVQIGKAHDIGGIFNPPKKRSSRPRDENKDSGKDG